MVLTVAVSEFASEENAWTASMVTVAFLAIRG
jgi:hypothetical protein